MKKKQQQQQQHPGGGADPWPHGAPLGGAPPGLGSWKRRVSLLPFLRFSLRDYGFCMATLLVFCLGSLFYQLGGGPPRFLLDLRQYLGKEGRRERGRREVVPGRGWRGGAERAGYFGAARAATSSRLPRWDAREHPCGDPERPLSVCLRRGGVGVGRRGVDLPGRYPRAGRRIPSPLPRPPRLGWSAGV